jgi:hypothetical protein
MPSLLLIQPRFPKDCARMRGFAIRSARNQALAGCLIREKETYYSRNSASLPAIGDCAMPQIWMTYDEIADLLGCDAEAARAMAIHRSLDRRKSRDGFTRTKLDLDWTARFIAAIREADPALDQAVRELRMMGDMMSRSGAPLGIRKLLLDRGAAAGGR